MRKYRIWGFDVMLDINMLGSWWYMFYTHANILVNIVDLVKYMVIWADMLILWSVIWLNIWWFGPVCWFRDLCYSYCVGLQCIWDVGYNVYGLQCIRDVGCNVSGMWAANRSGYKQWHHLPCQHHVHPRQRHVSATWHPRQRHVSATWHPRQHHVIATWHPRHRHVASMSSPFLVHHLLILDWLEPRKTQTGSNTYWRTKLVTREGEWMGANKNSSRRRWILQQDELDRVPKITRSTHNLLFGKTT
jgi:hypothetical protein